MADEASIDTPPSLGVEAAPSTETVSDADSGNGSDDALSTAAVNDAERGDEVTETPVEDLNDPSADSVQENPMDAIMARLEGLEAKLAEKEAKISSLASELEGKAKENASLKETVRKQPIVKPKKNLNRLVGNAKAASTEGKTPVQVGNKKFYV